jgi:hypothetical protein
MKAKNITELAADMLAIVPAGTSSIEVLIACNVMASFIIKECCPQECRRDAAEKFVSDFYDLLLTKDD